MWFIYLSNKWMPILGNELEDAYKSGKEKVRFSNSYVANFAAMMACSTNDPSKVFPIKRSDDASSADTTSPFTHKNVSSVSVISAIKKTFDNSNNNGDDDDEGGGNSPSSEPAKKVAKIAKDQAKTVKKDKGVLDTAFVQKNNDVNKYLTLTQ